MPQLVISCRLLRDVNQFKYAPNIAEAEATNYDLLWGLTEIIAMTVVLED
jgi:hypothetical protein